MNYSSKLLYKNGNIMSKNFNKVIKVNVFVMIEKLQFQVPFYLHKRII